MSREDEKNYIVVVTCTNMLYVGLTINPNLRSKESVSALHRLILVRTSRCLRPSPSPVSLLPLLLRDWSESELSGQALCFGIASSPIASLFRRNATARIRILCSSSFVPSETALYAAIRECHQERDLSPLPDSISAAGMMFLCDIGLKSRLCAKSTSCRFRSRGGEESGGAAE